MLQKSAINRQSVRRQAVLLNDKLFLRDLVLTLLAAILTGVSSGILLILLIFSWGAVEAGTVHEEAAELQLRSLDGQLMEQAPLLTSDIDIDINGVLARVRIEHNFINPSRSWMEGVYQFPLPEASAHLSLYKSGGGGGAGLPARWGRPEGRYDAGQPASGMTCRVGLRSAADGDNRGLVLVTCDLFETLLPGGELRHVVWAEAESAERFGLESGSDQNTITKHNEADPHISSSRLPTPGVSG